MVLVINRRTGRKRKERGDDFYRFLSRLFAYRLARPLPVFVPRYISLQTTTRCKQYFEAEIHAQTRIKKFIKKFHVCTREAAKPVKKYKNMQEFFQRHLKPSARKIAALTNSHVMICPADCRIMVFENVSLAQVLWIKGSKFTIESLLQSKTRGKQYASSSLVLCRLAPQDYHRFHFPVGGKYTITKHIKGSYLTVQPAVVRSHRNVLTENRRAVTYLRTQYFGQIAYVTIGATCVGSIVITAKSNTNVRKGQEYGTFAFGGSSIVLLIPKNKIEFSQDLVRNSYKKMETIVKMGEILGYTSKHSK